MSHFQQTKVAITFEAGGAVTTEEEVVHADRLSRAETRGARLKRGATDGDIEVEHIFTSP